MKTPLRLLALLALALLPIAPLRAADYTVTATSVVPSSDATITRGTAGATITAGQAVAKDTSNNTIVLFDANSGTAAIRTFAGIAVNGASAGQPINYATADSSFTGGFTVAAGAIVVGSATAGGLCPAADLASGHYVTVVGVGIGSNKIKLAPLAAGVAVP